MKQSIDEIYAAEEEDIYDSAQSIKQKQGIIVIEDVSEDAFSPIKFQRNQKKQKFNFKEENLEDSDFVKCKGEILICQDELLQSEECQISQFIGQRDNIKEEEAEFKDTYQNEDQEQWANGINTIIDQIQVKSQNVNQREDEIENNYQMNSYEGDLLDPSQSGILLGNYEDSDEQGKFKSNHKSRKSGRQEEGEFSKKVNQSYQFQNFNEDSEELLQNKLNNFSQQQKLVYLTNKIDRLSALKASIQKTQENSLYLTSKGKKSSTIKMGEPIHIQDVDEMHDDLMSQDAQVREKGKRTHFTLASLQLLRKKFQIFHNYENGNYASGQKLSLKQIATQTNFSTGSIYKLYNEWLQDPSLLLRFDKVKSSPKFFDDKLSQRRISAMQQLLKDKPYLNQTELTEQMNKYENLKLVKNGQVKQIDRSIIGKLLREANYRKKRLTMISPERNTAANIQIRYIFCRSFRKLQENSTKMYYLDECSFDLFLARDKIWSNNDQMTIPKTKDQRYALMALFGSQGLSFWKVSKNHSSKYEEMEEIKGLLKKVRAAELFKEPSSSILLLDPSIVKDQRKCSMLKELFKCRILFLPPHSPQLNPIDLWFMDLRKKIKAFGVNPDEQQLLSNVHKTLAEYQSFDFNHYYQEIDRFVDKGLSKQRF